MKPARPVGSWLVVRVGVLAFAFLAVLALGSQGSSAPTSDQLSLSRHRDSSRGAPPTSGGAPGAVALGSEKCAECHPEIASFYQAGRHHRPFFQGALGAGCESCHGPGSTHAESLSKADIINAEELRKSSAQQASDRCLSCHRSNLNRVKGWFLSEHARADVSCWDCHDEVLHHLAKDGKPLPAAAFVPNSKERITNLFALNPNEYCYRCHERQRMEFALPFRHPLERGKMACVDCHNPHAESWREEIVTHSVQNESDALCFRCHAEQRGPFIWQHQAMEEGCTGCHRPHGSPNRRLLRVSGNALCLQCHFERQLPRIGQSDHQSRLGRFARCVDCHIRPHGSNVSEDLTQ